LTCSCLLLILIFTGTGQAVFSNESPHSVTEQIKEINANIIFMRHALAPGYGDPEEFNLNSCETQRNLDLNGQQQAINIGNHFRSENLKFDAIYSSQWCRCLETAKLLNFNIEVPFAGLNSFFEEHAPRKETLGLLNRKMSQLDGSTLTLMVTHQVVISAITGIAVSSGQMIAYNTYTGKASLLVLNTKLNQYKH
jgi:phosphohistidine phosphatase SixA